MPVLDFWFCCRFCLQGHKGIKGDSGEPGRQGHKVTFWFLMLWTQPPQPVSRTSLKYFKFSATYFSLLCLLAGRRGWPRGTGWSRNARTPSKIFHFTLFSTAGNSPAVKHVNMGHVCLPFSIRWVILGPRWTKRPFGNCWIQRRPGKSSQRIFQTMNSCHVRYKKDNIYTAL